MSVFQVKLYIKLYKLNYVFKNKPKNIFYIIENK